MTNEQKQAIKEAAYKAWLSGNLEDAVLAGIEKYDELANKEFADSVEACICKLFKASFTQTKNIVPNIEIPKTENKPPESTPNNENIALFIPAGENGKNNIRIFRSAVEMFARLFVECESNIAVSDNKEAKYDSDWPNPKHLYKIYLDKNKIVHIGDYIGICDYQSFKKG